MDIIFALNSVITVLKQTHVPGSEALLYGKAINILVEIVKELEKVKKEKSTDEN